MISLNQTGLTYILPWEYYISIGGYYMLLYHGSQFIIEKPEFGKGKKNNDYGQGF
ncbi:MAG: DUF3990 domain-containing protein, partial [Acetatifactor sp.]|nr:DUF3990 domain-containing protein [Acetatifactor sp.]